MRRSSRTSSRARNRNGLALIAGLLCLATAACGSVSTRAFDEARSGGGGSTLRQPVGTIFTYGLWVLQNRSDEDVTILRVRPDLSPGLEYLGARMVPPERDYAAFDVASGWPAADLPYPNAAVTFPAEGATLRPLGKDGDGMGYQVLMGLEVVGPGRSTISSVEVLYEQGRERHRLVVDFPVASCTDPAADRPLT